MARARFRQAQPERWWDAVTSKRGLTLSALVLAIVTFGIVDYATLPPPLPAYAHVRSAWHPSEAWLYDRNGALIDSARVDFTARRLGWTPLDHVSPVTRDTIVGVEDKRFFSHGGVDWLALAGVARDKARGERARGASTLSMQVAGFLAPDLAAPGKRHFWDKLRQMRAAWSLESGWSKDQILEAYLNLAGFRGEAQGIGAAALGLFGKTPDALARDDAVLLAALLPDPQADPAAVARRACAVSHESDCTRFAGEAASMLGPARSLALDPGLAPHLSDRLLTKPGLKVTTTLDRRIQTLAIVALKRQLQGLGGARARDGAAVVIDNASGDVLAYVGRRSSSSPARPLSSSERWWGKSPSSQPGRNTVSNSSSFAPWRVMMVTRSSLSPSAASITSETCSRKPPRLSNSSMARTSSFRFSSRPDASAERSRFHMSV